LASVGDQLLVAHFAIFCLIRMNWNFSQDVLVSIDELLNDFLKFDFRARSEMALFNEKYFQSS
jgi:hypothetical protein